MHKETESPPKILVVDDDPAIRNIVSRFLRAQGYEVRSAEDGKSSRALFEEFSPHLIVMDINLPDANGYDLTQEMQSRTGVFVIMLTSRSDEADIIRGYNQGADDFITKPFSMVEMAARVATVLKRSGQSLLLGTQFSTEKKIEEERTVERLEKIISIITKKNENLQKIIKGYDGIESQESINLAERYRSITGAVSHNLRGEFFHIGTAIKELLDVAKDSDIETEIREECEYINRSLEYSQILLQKLLDHLNLGKLVTEIIELSTLMERIKSLVIPRLPSRINFKSSIDFNGSVLSNSDQLTIVILELVKNSTHALHERGGLIEFKIQDDDGITKISITDNGKGIPEDMKDKIFTSEVASKQGLGIGLFLCRRIIRELGSDLTIESSNKGTRATIHIPESKTVIG